MKQNKLSFESEKLVVDYISFNIPGSNNTESIAKYLFEKFNFNSTFAKGQNGTTYDWFYLNRNQHQVSFRELEYDPSSKSFWLHGAFTIVSPQWQSHTATVVQR